MRLPLCRLALTALLLGWHPASIHAQELPLTALPGTRTGQSPEDVAPKAIALKDLQARADRDENFANLVSARAATSNPTASLVPRLEKIEASADGKRQFGYEALHALPILRLESLDRHWAFDATQIARWKADFQSRTSPFTTDAADASRRLAEWRATRAALPPDTLPPALSARIDDVTAGLVGAEHALSAPLDAQIALGRRASQLEGRIQAGRQSVDNAIDDIDRRLLRLDAPPLWRAPAVTDRQHGIDVVNRTWEVESTFAREYSAAALANRRALGALQLLLLPALLWLWWWGRKHAADVDGEGGVPQVLRRPISSWILLAMIANLAFGTQAPLLIQQTAMIVALVPVLRLLPQQGRHLLDWWPYAVLVFYLLLRLSILFLDSSLMYRWYQLLLAGAAIATTLWLLWRTRRVGRADGADGRRARLVQGLAWSSVALLSVAMIANVVGNASLSEMLVAGLIDSGYMALLLYAAFNVFATLLRVVFAHPSAAGLHLVRVQNTRLLDALQKLLAWAAIAGWAVFTLQRFRLFRPVYATVHGAVTHQFTYGEFSLSLGDLLAFVLAILIAVWAARLVRVLLQRDVLSRMSLPRGVANSVASLAYYALLGIGLLAALSVAGFKIGQLTLLLGALGVGIGLGLQDVVKNFVSGLILMFERPVQPGDAVEIEGTAGQVRDIGMRATIIRTFEGADVVVPNGLLLSEKLTNWTLRDRTRRIQVDLGVAYGSDPARVTEVLLKATRSMPGITTDVPAQVLFQGFGDNALDFTVRAWTHDFDHWVSLRSQLIGRIYDALGEAGIGIPFPQRDLHLRSVSAEVRTALQRTPADPPPATPDAGDAT